MVRARWLVLSTCAALLACGDDGGGSASSGQGSGGQTAGGGGNGTGGAPGGGGGGSGAGGGAGGGSSCATICIEQIDVGGGHACARTTAGELYCWGANTHGQRGNGDDAAPPVEPTRVDSLSGVVDLALGSAHTCAVLDDGTVRCWGDNSQGQLGLGAEDAELHAEPVAVPGLSDIVRIDAGIFRTCAVGKSGTTRCWGYHTAVQFGVPGTADDQPAPTEVPGASAATQIALGDGHDCALVGSAVKCWGFNGAGELGTGSADGSPPKAHSEPQPVSGLEAATSIGAGPLFTCAVTAAGVRCWGWNRYGTVGIAPVADPADPNAVPAPAPPIPGLSGAKQVDAHGPAACAALSDGAVMCWGVNNTGQLGNGSHDVIEGPPGTACNAIEITGCPAHFEPSKVLGLAGAAHVRLGSGYACALTEAREVYCWGANVYGQVGGIELGLYVGEATRIAFPDP